MTRQADFKRRVRARMAKTGESYATARHRLLTEHPGTTPGDSPLDWMPEALHISNGDATDVPGTGLARRVVYWRDVLHEGPVPAVTPAELLQIRAEYLAGPDSTGPGRAEVMRHLTERDQAVDASRDGDYVLWFEADLYDQLQVAQILARLADLGVPAGRVTLICIGEHPGIARFGGLGELTAGQLRELPHTSACARLTPAALALATRAWAAFRAPAPRDLGDIAGTRLGELRFLGEAFDRLSREYPATRDGLSLTERRVLAAVADGAADAGTAFVRAGARETRPFMGDTTCFRRMDYLARGAHPLLLLDPPGGPVERTTGLHLTAAGARVLAGQADHVALNGIDRWIGGVHLQGHHVPWRWDDGTETIVWLLAHSGLDVVQAGVEQGDLGGEDRDWRFRGVRQRAGGYRAQRSRVRLGRGDRHAGRGDHRAQRAERGQAGAGHGLLDLDGRVEPRHEFGQAERGPAGRAVGAHRGEVPPANQAGPRVGEDISGAAANAPGVTDDPDPLLAVTQPALIADVTAGRDDLKEQRAAVLRSAAQRSHVGQFVQAVEPAAAPAAGRQVPGGPYARRVGRYPVYLIRTEGEPGEPGPRPVRGQHGVRQLVPRERLIGPFAARCRVALAEQELAQDRPARGARRLRNSGRGIAPPVPTRAGHRCQRLTATGSGATGTGSAAMTVAGASTWSVAPDSTSATYPAACSLPSRMAHTSTAWRQGLNRAFCTRPARLLRGFARSHARAW
jgi:hypothetical protein